MNKEILRLAVPNIISNITVPLLGMVDMFIAGHLDSAEYIAAIGTASTIFNLIYWNFSFLRMGTSGFTAQAYGADNKPEQINSLVRSLTVAFTAGVLIIIFQSLILRLGFFFVNAGETVRLYASTYFGIYIWAAPAILGMYALTGWYVGMQNTRIPMYVSIGINIVNIGLSFLFVYGLGMKIEGIAIASVCAQYSGLISSVIICHKQNRILIKYFDIRILKNIRGFVPFFKVNTNIFIRTMALVAVTTSFMSASAWIGDDILALNALLMQFFMLFSYMMDGFAYAAEALTGRFIGARNFSFLRILPRRLFMWGGIIVLIFTMVYALFADPILRMLTDKENIIQLAGEYKQWILLFPIAGFSAFLWDGIFVGATASRQMRNSMLIAAGSFFIIYAFLYFNYKHNSVIFISSANNILWFAFIVYLALRGIVQTFMAGTILKESK